MRRPLSMFPRPRLSYANVMSTIGVFIALGGTSYAVAKLPKNSVGAAQLQANVVTSDKIRDGAIAAADLAPGVAQSGPRGPRGAEGATGPIGPSEVINAVQQGAASLGLAAGASVTVVATTVPAGSWSLSAKTRVVYGPVPAGSEWFDCDLRTGAGDMLDRSTGRVGNDDNGALAQTLPEMAAVTFATPTQVVLSCAHPSNIAGDPAQISNSAIQATRVGSIDQR